VYKIYRVRKKHTETTAKNNNKNKSKLRQKVPSNSKTNKKKKKDKERKNPIKLFILGQFIQRFLFDEIAGLYLHSL
jgi:hypothetical protein